MTHDSLALAPPLSGARARQAFLFGGFLLILMNFASPAGGAEILLTRRAHRCHGPLYGLLPTSY